MDHTLSEHIQGCDWNINKGTEIPKPWQSPTMQPPYMVSAHLLLLPTCMNTRKCAEELTDQGAKADFSHKRKAAGKEAMEQAPTLHLPLGMGSVSPQIHTSCLHSGFPQLICTSIYQAVMFLFTVLHTGYWNTANGRSFSLQRSGGNTLDTGG